MTDPAGPRGRGLAVSRGTWLALLVLVAAPFVFYASMIVGGQEPPAADTAASRPFSLWGREVTAQTGQVPDWYPYVMSGMPSYGSYTYTPRSPFNPVSLAQRLCGENRGAYYWFLFSVAGLAGYAFLRRQGFSREASTIAALLFSMTPYLPGVVQTGHSTKLEALCLLPVFLLALDMFLERPGPVRAAFLAGAVAMLGWSNHPQVAFYGLLVGFIYTVAILVLEKRAAGRGYWLRFAGFAAAAVALVAGLAAEPYLAVREFAPWSIRGAGASGEGGSGVGWDYATAWSFHPRELISFLFPGWFGLQGRTYWGPMPFTQSTHYFGIAAAALAVFGLGRTAGRRRWIWGGISILVLFIGFGRFLPLVYGPMFKLMPLFNKFRVPSMAYSILPLCLAFPIAAGIDALLAVGGAADAPARPAAGAKRKGAAPAPAAGSKRLLVAAIVVAVVGIVIAVSARGAAGGNVYLRPEEAGRLSPAQLSSLYAERVPILQKSVIHGTVVILLGLGLLALRRSRGASAWLGLLAGLVVIGDVVIVGRSFYEVEPRREARASLPFPGACDFLSRQPGAFRILPAASSIFSSNAFGLAKLESVGGYHTARLRAYQDLLGADLVMRPATLSMLNVHYILAPSKIAALGTPLYEGDGFVYAWPDSLPRAWAVRRIEQVPGFEAVKQRLEGDDFRPEEVALAYPADAPSAAEFSPARINVAGRGPGSLRLSVEAAGNAFVVVSEIAYPPGWVATIDGRPAPLRRVDHVLMGLEVPEGRHDVVLTMHSPGRLKGVRVSRFAATLTLALAAAALAWERFGSRRAKYPDA